MVTNSRGDVVGIVNGNGVMIVNYEYDAWGNVLSVTDQNGAAITSAGHLGNLNSLRYRGYYYDTDLGMYYLQSRYYDPEVRRFINADDVSVLEEDQGSIVEHNLFAYCLNNPISNDDSEGEAAANIIGAAVGGLTGAALGCVLVKKLKLKGWKRVALITAATAGGAVLGALLGPYVAKLGRKIGAAVKKTFKSAKKNVKSTKKNVKNTKTGVKSTKTGCVRKGACFIVGTLIAIENGHKKIEDIEVGDYVWAENPEMGEKALKQVTNTFIRETNELVHIDVDGEKITTTPEHPFYVPQKGWVKAIDLRAGEILVLRSGKYVIVEKIQHEILENPTTVYNFEVEDFHTYYVGSSDVLVHNMCPTKNTSRKTLVGGKITGYTKHGLAQAIGRDGGKGVSSSAILDTVKNPTKVVKQANGTIKYISKKAVVVLNKAGKIVTTYAKSSKYWR